MCTTYSKLWYANLTTKLWALVVKNLGIPHTLLQNGTSWGALLNSWTFKKPSIFESLAFRNTVHTHIYDKVMPNIDWDDTSIYRDNTRMLRSLNGLMPGMSTDDKFWVILDTTVRGAQQMANDFFFETSYSPPLLCQSCKMRRFLRSTPATPRRITELYFQVMKWNKS